MRAFPSPNGLSVFFRDVTEQKRYERAMKAALAEARESNRAKDLFLAPYVFDEFRQAENGPVRRHEGAGLGLAISR
jgi:hypothetical protein